MRFAPKLHRPDRQSVQRRAGLLRKPRCDLLGRWAGCCFASAELAQQLVGHSLGFLLAPAEPACERQPRRRSTAPDERDHALRLVVVAIVVVLVDVTLSHVAALS